MGITAALVKELRERTGSGMMECKKTLVETNGDIEAAIELMRKTGMAKADKKAGRTAAEGCIIMRSTDDDKRSIIIEVNCETDFVTKSEDFISFTKELSEQALANNPADLDALLVMPLGDLTVDKARQALIAKIGENINVRRYESVSTENGVIGQYLHGERIGVLVSLENGGNAALAKDVAMHIAAINPTAISVDDVSSDLIEKEKEIFSAQASESGKPPEIIEKMIAGRIRKYLAEITLLGQSFVKNPDVTVEKLLKESNANVTSFIRFEVGEGIEKKVDNFAEEVMAQVKGA
ncbi:MAG: translation elongation factor Ts [Gammaproteobacteria bacterium]|nr:translation elongation factor Ts [Gammaproteobacteria bacterium]